MRRDAWLRRWPWPKNHGDGALFKGVDAFFQTSHKPRQSRNLQLSARFDSPTGEGDYGASLLNSESVLFLADGSPEITVPVY